MIDWTNESEKEQRDSALEDRMAKAAFCKAAGIDQSNLTKWLNGSWWFGPESLARIEAQLSKGKQ